jgi:Domain of unknown function (DUF5668)
MYRYNRRCSCDRCKAHALMAPAILVTVGVLFLLEEFGSGLMSFERTWPLILIVIGGVILARRNASIDGHIDPAQGYVVMQQPMSAVPAPVPPASSDSGVHHG